MNEKQLTSDQIKELHKLVERNAIKYYDVEVEIVDHYASAIEEIWAKDPSVSFYRAQMMVYKEFWDFQGLQKDKQLALLQRANQEHWEHLKGAFTWPKVVELIGITMLSFYGFTMLFKIISPQSLNYIIILFGIVGAIFQFGEVSIFKKKLGHSFLRLDTILASFSLMLIFGLNIFNHLLNRLDINSTTAMMGISMIFALFFIMAKETYQIFRKELVNHKKQYA